MTVRWRVEQGVDDAFEKQLARGLGNDLPPAVAPYCSLAFAVRLEPTAEEITPGGITAEMLWGWLYIKLLWVAPALRGRGLGRQLLMAAEEEGRRQGCEASWVSTYSFQAPTFYQACGYRPMGRLDDFPKGHQRLFLWKTI